MTGHLSRQLEQLHQLKEIFAYKGEVQILLCLATSESLRFSQLATLMVENSTARVADTTLSRSLTRLREAGLVMATDHPARRTAYSLTPAGRARADTIEVLAAALAGRQREPADSGQG